MKKNTKLKIASAEDILNYLRATSVDGISNTSKKDVARHFGYKTSNGEGFLSNFKMLEEEGLIQDVSSSKKNGRWKVDMTSAFSSQEVKKKKQNNNHYVDIANPLSVINLDYLTPIDFAGRKYIPLTSVAAALGIDKHAVYNAASSSNRLVVPYTRTIPIDSDDKKSNSKKSIEVEGLSFLFDRLKKHVDKRIFAAVVDYVNSIANDDLADNNISEEHTEDKSTVVSLSDYNSIDSAVDNIDVSTENDVDDIVESEVNLNANTTPINTIDIEDYSHNNMHNTTNVEEYDVDNSHNTTMSSSTLSVEEDVENHSNDEQTNTTDFNSNTKISDASEMLAILDGMLNILSEHSSLKEEVKSLKNENNELQQEVLHLKEEEQKLATESLHYINLKEENEKLKKELNSVNNTNTEILSKANMIKQYVLSNKMSM